VGLIVNPTDLPVRSGSPTAARKPPLPTPKTLPEEIEPRRKRRISMSREPISGRLDLHGLTQDQARAAVLAFIRRAYDDGSRAVLIITGKGAMGDGVLRRCTPEWLADPAIRPLIAGLSTAERHHGGEGALYVALKRRHR
jgi:DNA-nicking Smr family endonuclease